MADIREEMIERAMGYGLITFSPEKSENDNSNGVFYSASGLLYLILEERRRPNDRVRARIIEHIENLVSGGKEPRFDNCCYWVYVPLSGALAIARHTPSVWDALSDETKDKVDLCMRSFAVMSAFGTHDENNYATGIGMLGNYGKGWNPNYRFSNVAPILSAVGYFGSPEAVNDILVNFDYDSYLEKFHKYNFTRTLWAWEIEDKTLPDGTFAPGSKTLLEKGGPAFYTAALARNGQNIGAPAGSGVGVKQPYVYNGHPLATDLIGIVRDLLGFNFSGGKVVSAYGKDADGNDLCYILDHTKSPVEGFDGMMREWASGDANGIRSSGAYCSHDLILAVVLLAALDELGTYDVKKDDELFPLVWVGNEDTIYKMEHGYRSFSLGNGYDSHEEEYGGYPLWKYLWETEYKPFLSVDKLKK